MMGFDSTLGPTYTRASMVGAILRGAAVFALFVSPSFAWAQDGAATPPPAAEAFESDATQPAADNGVETRRRRKDELRRQDRDRLRAGNIDPNDYTLAQKQASVETSISSLRQAVARATTLLEQASAESDVVKTNCVRRKLRELRGLLRTAQRASEKMYDAIGKGQTAKVDKQFLKIMIASSTGQASRADAEQCVGANSIFTGDTEVEVEIDPNIPEIDPTQPNLPPPGPSFPPPATLIGPE